MKILIGDSVYNLGFLSDPEDNSELRYNINDQTLVRNIPGAMCHDQSEPDLAGFEERLAEGPDATALWRLIQKISPAVANVIDGDALLKELDGEEGELEEEILAEQRRIRLEGQRVKRDRIKSMTFERMEALDRQRRGYPEEPSLLTPPNLFEMPPSGGKRN